MNNNAEGRNTHMTWEEISGPPLTREEVLGRIRDLPDVYHQFLNLTTEIREELVAFSMGVQGAKMTYDPFFKHVFDPIEAPERLEDFIGQCLGEEVEILEVIPNESRRLTAESSFLIADLVVQLKSGALVNVEIQRTGYYFPGARCACYSSDLVMRQYAKVRSQRNREKKPFSYGDIKKVYTIVLMHRSTEEFHAIPNEYLHYAKQTFKSGLQMDLLQEYLLVPLDIFLKIPHNKLSKLDAWLYFIGSDKIEDIQKVCEAYPEFQLLYREVFRFRYHPKELVEMFSEALRILDKATEQYMVDDFRKRAEEAQREAEEAKKGAEEARKEAEEAKKELEQARREAEEAEAELEGILTKRKQTMAVLEQTETVLEQTEAALKQAISENKQMAAEMKRMAAEIERLQKMSKEK